MSLKKRRVLDLRAGSSMATDLLIPPLIALCAALISSIAGGVGDAVTFHTLWTLAGTVGIIPIARLRKAVLYASLVPLSNMPLMLNRAWLDVCRFKSWGLIVAAASAITTPIGARLLFAVDVVLIKRIAGLVFLVFGLMQLISAKGCVAKQRAEPVGTTRAIDALDEEETAPGPFLESHKDIAHSIDSAAMENSRDIPEASSALKSGTFALRLMHAV